MSGGGDGAVADWLSDAEWARIEPLLPRGRCGARRVDDRWMIPGIVHRLGIGARWSACPAGYGPYTTIYNRLLAGAAKESGSLSCRRRLARAGLGVRSRSVPPASRFTVRPGARNGAFTQAIGTSRGGQTSKLHGLTDSAGRPPVILISPGNTSDMTVAPALIEAAAGGFDRLIADGGYDGNTIRAAVAGQGAVVVIPPTRSSEAPMPYKRDAYRARSVPAASERHGKTYGLSDSSSSSLAMTTIAAGSDQAQDAQGGEKLSDLHRLCSFLPLVAVRPMPQVLAGWLCHKIVTTASMACQAICAMHNLHF